MKEAVQKELDLLFLNYPELRACESDITGAFGLLLVCSRQKSLIMTCGNGGSAADAGHIVGELMKGFKQKRPLTNAERGVLESAFPSEGAYLATHLQRGIPALSLCDQVAITTAFINDVAPDMVFAQQVFGYGKAGDVLIALSTSGNSRNVVNACQVANAFQIKTIGLTGESGGKMKSLCDITIRVPAYETYRIQEYHLPIYHTLCSMLEIANYS
ncbi:MAG: SIS domain-containing protein [Tannerellaceae bacterium]|jgi:D-sedoheptulose 7-phosphate isomerase|nr:SIS domain-containing protein [Tannerellaceae bacterium]